MGKNQEGQLGLGEGVTQALRPMILNLNVNVVDVSCGGFHSLLLTDQGQVYSFGSNSQGQLGLGFTSQELM